MYYYIQNGMYRIDCTDWGVQTDIYRLVYTIGMYTLGVYTVTYRLVYTDSSTVQYTYRLVYYYVPTGMYRQVCSGNFVYTCQ